MFIGASSRRKPDRIDKVVSLQTVWQIEDDLPAIVVEIKRVGKDVLCPDTPGKVVALPVRSIARGMAFHDPVVIGDARIIEPRPPHTRTPGAVSMLPTTSTSSCSSNSRSVEGRESSSWYRGGAGSCRNETSRYERRYNAVSSVSVTVPVVLAARFCAGASNAIW